MLNWTYGRKMLKYYRKEKLQTLSYQILLRRILQMDNKQIGKRSHRCPRWTWKRQQCCSLCDSSTGYQRWKINKEKAENIESSRRFNSGQYQMIFGTGTVNKIYDEVVAQGLPTVSKDEQKAEAAKQGNWFQRAIRSLVTFSFHCFQ